MVLKATIENVMVAVLTAVILAALTLLWNFTSGGGLVRLLGGGVPVGAIVAFDRSDLDEEHCPDGWSVFLDARGRTLVGAGDPQKSSMPLDEKGRKLEGYTLRQHGGETVHHLTLDELPSYSPAIFKQNGDSFAVKEGAAVPCLDGDSGCNHLGVITEGRPGLSTTPLTITGFGKNDSSFNLKPPYFAAYYCKKND